MTTRKAVKALVGIIAVAFGIWAIVPELLLSISRQAIITADVSTVSAPIAGRVQGLNVNIGDEVRRNAELAAIRNERVDVADVKRLKTEIAGIEAELPAIDRQITQLDIVDRRMELRQRLYSGGRTDQLSAQLEEARAQQAAANARLTIANLELKRIRILKQRDVAPQANLDRALAERDFASAAVESSKQRRKAIIVELEAARQGTYLGDSFNDQPYSVQRRDDIRLRRIDLEARKHLLESRLPILRDEHAALAARAELLAKADLKAPASGRVWTVDARSGEFVDAGKHVLHLLNCRSVSIIANVSESDYNLLRIGDRAVFRPYGGSERYPGTIIKLAGAGSARGVADDAMAIPPRARNDDDFLVFLSAPGLVTPCTVGRTGTVTFATGNVLIRRIGDLLRRVKDRIP